MQAFHVEQSESSRQIVVLGTGGTIAGLATQAGDNLAYQAAQVQVDRLLHGVALPAGVQVLSEQIAQVDSKDMNGSVWAHLARRSAAWLAQPQVCGVVVTHGTDTLEETAYFLQAVLAPTKPLVLTCAMRPSNAAMPDGPQNLSDALAVAACAGASGVTAVCAGVVHGAADVRKLHGYRLDAFGSGDAGPVGYVEEGAVRCVRQWPQLPAMAGALDRLPTQGLRWPRVDIVTSHAGADGAIVDALVQAGVQGLVVAGTGNGSVHEALLQALLRARSAGVRVLRASRCDQGRVMGRPDDVLPHADALSPVKARIRLMLELLVAA